MLNKIQTVISEQTGINPEDIKPESAFVEDLNIDSLDLVELIMTLEDEYGVEIDEDDAESIKTVNDLIAYIKNNLEQ